MVESYEAGNKQDSIPIWFKRFILIVGLSMHRSSLLLLVEPWYNMNAGIYQFFFDHNRFTLQFSNSETEKILKKSLPRHWVDSRYKSEDILHSSVREKQRPITNWSRQTTAHFWSTLPEIVDCQYIYLVEGHFPLTSLSLTGLMARGWLCSEKGRLIYTIKFKMCFVVC